MAEPDDSRDKRRKRQREYMRKWKAANPDKVKAISRKSRERNRARKRATDRAWKIANRDKIRAWRTTNKEKVNAQKRAARAANHDKVVAQERERKARNPEKLAYYRQMSAAQKRNIPFLLTYEQWWNIWQTSGRWELRGRRRGQYCMARDGDLGAYEIGNVRIILGRDNLAEADQSYRHRPRSDEWRKNISAGIKRYYARVRHATDGPLV